MSIRTAFAGTALALVCAASLAQTATPRVDQREANQDARIQQGVASGQLNARETYRLEKEQARINAVEVKAKSDGHVTAKERGRLHKLQNGASRDTHRQKHDRQTAPGR